MKTTTRWPRIVDGLFIVAVVGLAIALRISLLDFKSIDFFNYTKVWFNTLKETGFAAFKQDFANYNLPYLYLLYLVARYLPTLPAVVATKLPSLAADFIAAWYAYRIVALDDKAQRYAALAAFAVLFAPTMVLNSALWGQADALYTCAVLAGIYYILRGKDAAAMALFGLSLGFKAQAAFVLPLILALFLRGRIRWKLGLIVPVVMVACLIPALLAGRPLMDLLLIYPAQAGQYQQLTLHAPSALSWVPDGGRYYPYFYPASLIFACAAAIAYSWAVYRSPRHLTPSLLVELALIAAILVPFTLPKMHERYFYLADILSIILVFYQPTFFFVPVLMITISFFAYQPTLFGIEPVPIGFLALGVLALLILLSRHALSTLFPPAPDS